MDKVVGSEITLYVFDGFPFFFFLASAASGEALNMLTILRLMQRILKYGTKWDIVLMVIGAVAALVTGVAL